MSEYRSTPGAFAGVRIYDTKAKTVDFWEPTDFVARHPKVFIAANNEFIVLTVLDTSYIYDKLRVFQRKIEHRETGFKDTYLTQNNYLWISEDSTSLLFVTDLQNDDKITYVKGVYRPGPITGTRDGHVIVRDYTDFHVYSETGTFLHALDIENEWVVSEIAVIKAEDEELSFAIGPLSSGQETIKIYSLKSSGEYVVPTVWLVILIGFVLPSFNLSNDIGTL